MQASDAVQRLFKSVRTAVAPPIEVSYSEWARENFRLSPDSPSPGRFKPWKYQEEWLDVFGNPEIPRVTIIKSARIGFTVSLAASLAARIVNDPCPIILLTPRDADSKGIMVDDIDPHFKATPSVQAMMRTGRYDGRNTLTYRSLVGGGSLKSLSAETPNNLRRHRARVLLCDEVDGMKVTKEGDPLKIAEFRTQDYADRKIVMGSTPTDDLTSIIVKRYAESDQRVFEIPCPQCSDAFELQWEHLEWKRGRYESVVAICPSCGHPIEERHKAGMVAEGIWRPTDPEIIGHWGYRINALVSSSPNAAWPILVHDFEVAEKGGPSTLQPFHNMVLGRVWTNSIDYVSENALLSRVEEFGINWDHEKNQYRVRIPEAVAYMTVGVDVSPDRLELTLMGWSPDQRFVLAHVIIRGSARLSTTWDELDAYVSTFWRHPLGGEIGISAVCVDSGDGNTVNEVLDFCEPRANRKIVAIKGDDGLGRPILKPQAKKRNRLAAAYIVGVDGVKTDILTSLSIDIEAKNAIRFSDTLDEQYFRQLTAERRETVYVAGRPTVKFVRIERRRAEALDCAVYAIAAKNLCHFNFDARYAELRGKPLPQKTTRELVQKLHNL